MSCRFCARAVAEVHTMIEGPDELRICDLCVDRARAAIATAPRVVAECSFCCQSTPPVHYAHRGVAICDPCVALCVEIVAEQQLPAARVVKTRAPR